MVSNFRTVYKYFFNYIKVVYIQYRSDENIIPDGIASVGLKTDTIIQKDIRFQLQSLQTTKKSIYNIVEFF